MSVSGIKLGAPSYTLAHEIGHNMGCLHNREDSTGYSDYEFSAFSFGKSWIEDGVGYGTLCHTILLQFPHTRIQFHIFQIQMFYIYQPQPEIMVLKIMQKF